ncbi:type 1 phosphatidylinositol 4,5-bisphosphate 4-phosphatase-like, partial [Temnothorax nylanderi]|uniref:type 1 phosphatidylinositol 4,5-bisphosphate 4-phosphatase-like n=1 Tax=Temnothorax nylanderi TaxID=102681 RepID=UPI003A8B61E7
TFCLEAYFRSGYRSGRDQVARCKLGHCLLICKSSSQRIACPRPNCKRIIIDLAQSPITPPVLSMPGMCRVGCAHCHDTFLFNTLNSGLIQLVRCPHCRKISSVGPNGPNFARRRGIVLIIFGIIVLVITTTMAVTVGTHIYAVNGTIYLVYFCGFLMGLVSLGHGIYYCTMKNSLIEDPV